MQTRKNIWQDLKNKGRPIRILAPMEDVTDHPFRLLISSLAPPDLFFTEFMSVEGYDSLDGRSRVARRLVKNDQDSPIIAQIWGLDEGAFYRTAQDLSKMGFDGIDLNLGCPIKKIIKKGACSGMIGSSDKVRSIIDSIRSGAPHLPISIKTRIGIDDYSLSDWISFLPTLDIDAVTLHLRTQKQLSIGPAHWEYMSEIVSTMKKINPNLIIIGNGDIYSVKHLDNLALENGMDGGMIGRAVFLNPFIFSSNPERWQSFSGTERLKILIKHVDLYDQVYSNSQGSGGWNRLKRFFKIYINDFAGAAEIRSELMKTNNTDDFKRLLKKIKI